MKNYSNIILNMLIDKYERSSLYKGENTVNVKISIKLTKDTLPDYFNEYRYELKDEINTQCLHLAEKGYIKIYWKKYQEGNIIEKVELNLDLLDDIYTSVNRVKKASLEQATMDIIEPYMGEDNWLGSFAADMIIKLTAKSSIKKYLDIEDIEAIKDIFKALQAILKIDSEIPKRVLSIQLYNDSKRLEALESKITRIMIDFGGYEPDTDVLAECNVVSNPGFVYLKGKGKFKCNSGDIDLKTLSGEIALGINLIKNLNVIELNVQRILTIENLTSFHTYFPKDELVIYLGGYHNSGRRELLKKLYGFNRDIEFHHWGDIDLGGFRIINHLRRKTGIPFKSYLMGVETLRDYIKYSKTIENKAYLDQLAELLNMEEYREFNEVIRFMIENRVRLEQEIIM